MNTKRGEEMSKLLNALEARFTGDRKALISYPTVNVSENIEDVPYDSLSYQYVIQARFGAEGFCQKKDLNKMHENVFKQLKLEIYSDLQKRILLLERQVFEECMPSDSLRGMLQDIKTEIF